MKSIFLFCSFLLPQLNAQNSCCPESDGKIKCNPIESLNCTDGAVFELDRTAFADENFYVDGSILVYEDELKRKFYRE